MLMDQSSTGSDEKSWPLSVSQTSPFTSNPNNTYMIEVVADLILSDDPYTAEQLKAPRINKLLVRPLVNQLYNPHNIFVGRNS